MINFRWNFFIAMFVAVMFMLSGCSKVENTTSPNITETPNTTNNEVTEKIPTNNEIIPEVSKPTLPVCGDKILDAQEKCDGGVPLSVSCQSNGYEGGSVSCTEECTLNFDACIKTVSCKDTDDGLNYNVKGTVTVENNGSISKYTDYCRQANGPFEGYVFEHYCANDTVKTENYRCPKRCNNGACY